jgi:hypothetical protein
MIHIENCDQVSQLAFYSIIKQNLSIPLEPFLSSSSGLTFFEVISQIILICSFKFFVEYYINCVTGKIYNHYLFLSLWLRNRCNLLSVPWNIYYLSDEQMYVAVWRTSKLKSSVLWDIMLYSPLKANQRFGGTYCLHLQGWTTFNGHGIISKMVELFFITTTVRTSNPTSDLLEGGIR